MTQITLSEISKTYTIKHKPVTALSNINFTVNNSAFLVLTGPSGSGKSTILQLISGIEQPTSGQIIIDGQNITKMTNSELTTFRRKKVGIIFQQFYLEPTLTLRQNIELPAIFFNLSPEERNQRTKELANLMGLSEHLDHLPSQLSGGQIQRAAVARAIYNKPSILIADEPTSNLDHDNIHTVINLFKQIQQTYGTTIIIAAHDQTIANEATQVIKLDAGRIVI
ncbi:MAG: ABC transporter ATP-binding protein [Candidatus Nomurabacteria bacterium]|jgi:putative ABC transport system ATP-binding protein|nr:ABC transporter ATP-binding protein [Candidatus Nomurabacteria bacterium]